MDDNANLWICWFCNSKILKLPQGEKLTCVKHLFSPGKVIVVLWGQCWVEVHVCIRSLLAYKASHVFSRVHRTQVYSLTICPWAPLVSRHRQLLAPRTRPPGLGNTSLPALPSVSRACPQRGKWCRVACTFHVWLLSLILKSVTSPVMLTCRSLLCLAFSLGPPCKDCQKHVCS